MASPAAPDRVFVDTQVLLHADDAAFPERCRQARAWLQALWLRRSGRLSTQVLGEYYLLATQRLQPPGNPGDARAEVRRYQHWKPWPTDHQTVETAWAMESRFGLAWWDALTVAAAIHQGCRYLLSVQLPHGAVYDSVQVLDPFRVGPEALDDARLIPSPRIPA